MDLALRDLIASVKGSVEAHHSIAARYDFGSYGIPSNTADLAGVCRFWFAGRAARGVGSRWSMQARDDDPNSGQFLTADQLRLLSGARTHRYAKNLPVGYLDRTRLSEVPAPEGDKDGRSFWPTLSFDQFVNLFWDKLRPDRGFSIAGGKATAEARLEAIDGLYTQCRKHWRESLLFRELSVNAYSRTFSGSLSWVATQDAGARAHAGSGR